MERKTVYVDVTVRLIIEVGEGQDVDEVLQELDYNFTASKSCDAEIVNTEINDWNELDVS